MKKSAFWVVLFSFMAGCGEEHAAKTTAQSVEVPSLQAVEAVSIQATDRQRRGENLDLAKKLLAEFRWEKEQQGPRWADAVLWGNNTIGETCRLFARFNAGKELRDLMHDIKATTDEWEEAGIAIGDFADLWRGVAMDTAPLALAILKNPPSNKFAKCIRDGVIIFLHDELKLVRLIIEALRIYTSGPATIGSSEQELRGFLIRGAKRLFVEDLRPRLKNSPDAQGAVQKLLEEYALAPEDIGLTKEETDIVYPKSGNDNDEK